VLRAGEDGHVDLRNPALYGGDNIVIDYDGALYPSDEARMLARIGHVDLAIGNVRLGLRQDVVDELNGSALNNFDPDCIHCPYQPFCGSDVIDDLSRYRRIDLPRTATWFCQRQLAVFDRIMRLLASEDPRERFSLQHWAGLAAWPSQLAPVHHDPAAHPC
jgi:radical SAM protein with 4Fe4S-binding SPASM domain